MQVADAFPDHIGNVRNVIDNEQSVPPSAKSSQSRELEWPVRPASVQRLPRDDLGLAAGQQPAAGRRGQRQPEQQDQHVGQRHVTEQGGQAGVRPDQASQGEGQAEDRAEQAQRGRGRGDDRPPRGGTGPRGGPGSAAIPSAASMSDSASAAPRPSEQPADSEVASGAASQNSISAVMTRRCAASSPGRSARHARPGVAPVSSFISSPYG
jgi:hypothetical protein